MTFKLRSYQLESINSIYDSVKKGHHSIIVQSPPRTGKTVIMSEIARRATKKGNRVMFVVHRKEIVDQVIKTFKANEVDMSLTQIGMVQTFARRVDTLSKPTIIFVDEAHHVLARSYRKILERFPEALKLLFTATPVRLNGEGFEDVADDLIIGKPISWLIDNQFLAPVDYYAPVALDTSKLKTKCTGDYDEESIRDAFKPKIYGKTVEQYLKLANGMQAIAYTYNVASAEKLAAQFCKKGILAKAVSGNTPKIEREQIINDYRAGKVRIVTNAKLFTEGLDLPNVDCVIMLRPTKSLSLYLQFAMRSMNPRKDKTAIIIDQVGNVQRFGLPTQDRCWSLEGTKKQKESNRPKIQPVSTCPSCFAAFYRKGNTCPFCGADLIEEKVIEVDDKAELKKVVARRKEIFQKIINNKVARNVAGKHPSELKSYAEAKAYGKLKGYNPRWAYMYSKQRGFL